MRRTALLLLALTACSDEIEDPIQRRVEALLAQMTLEEKVAEKAGISIGSIDELYLTAANERLGIPAFEMVDGPRGVRAGRATAFPVGMARGATFDVELERRVGRAIGLEAKAKGANVILAPVVNLLRHPGWGRAQETYGEDSHHLGRMGAAFVEGAQTEVIASVKHFALNSIENTRFTVDVTADERTLREVYLRHFEHVVKVAKVGSVMSAYNKVNGFYCSENAHLLTDILKGEWGFEGFVESDWLLGVHSTVEAANAGLDIEMPFGTFFGEDLVKAVRTGHVRESTIDASVRRTLRAKLAFGLDQDDRGDPAVVESAEHLALAREVARRSIVLLKNDGVLPLDRGRITRIAIAGELADRANLGDEGSSAVRPTRAITPLQGILSAAGAIAVDHVRGATLTAAARDVIAAADVAIVVTGLTATDEGELLPAIGGGDRTTLGLGAREQLIREVAAANPRTIVVLEGGSAITVAGWIDEVEGLFMAWYPGSEGGAALAELLFGDANPSGKLPISFPRSEDQLPDFVADRDAVTYGYYHGYRHLDREGAEPQFPFGFGLSYTRFEYGAASVSSEELGPDDTVTVSVDVTNAGDRAGIEIVELYAGFEGSSVDRPVRTLAGFAAVALEPGETRRVSMALAAADLAYYDVAAAAWVVEPIRYPLELGGSSRDRPASTAFRVR